MAGAFVSAGGGNKTAGSSHTESITIPSCDLFIIGAFRTILDLNSPAAPTSVTVNGVAATDVGQSPTGDQNTEWAKMYYYLTPPTGSQSIVISGSGGTAIDTGFSWAAYTGFQQSGQPDSSGKLDLTTTTAAAISTTVVSSNAWLIGILANQGITPSSYTNGTERKYSVPNGGFGIFDSNGVVGTGSQTVTINSSNQRSNGILASFVLAASASTVSQRKALLGVGL